MSGDDRLPWGADADLGALRARPVAGVDNAFTRSERRNAALPGRRSDYGGHLNQLRGEFLGRSEVLFVHAGLVVALRRGIALPLFRRPWAGQGDFLRGGLSLRAGWRRRPTASPTTGRMRPSRRPRCSARCW